MDVRSEQIKILHAQGKSYGEMADALSVTRNAIAGKVNRMVKAGILPRRASVSPTKGKPRSPKRKTTIVRIVKAFKSAQYTPYVSPEPAEPPPDPLLIPLLNLTDSTCKFEVDSHQHLFCGIRSKGSWCDYHRGVVFEKIESPPQQRRRMVEPDAESGDAVQVRDGLDH